MNNILILITFVILLSCTYALTPEEALDKYYSSSTTENIDEYLSVLDTTGMSGQEIADEKKLVELIWNTVDEQSYSIHEIRKVLTEDGKTALLNFILTSSYKNTATGEVTSFSNIEHVALLSNDSGDWKVIYSIPFEEYLKLRDLGIQAIEMERQLEEGVQEILRVEEQGGVPKVLIDGEPYDGNGDSQPPVPGDFIDFLINIVIVIIVLLILYSIIKSVFKKKKPKEKKEVVKKVEKKEEKAVEKKPEDVKAPEIPRSPKPTTKKEFSDAMKVLRKRYASGEITKEQFQEMKKELEV